MLPEKAKILIIDDVISNIQVVGKILTDTNYNISYATSAKAAYEKIENVRFDLILLDIMMPEIDGFELCEHLKNNVKTRNIPVIFLTAKTDEESMVKAFELGGQDYITKPFRAEELKARIKLHLQLKFQSEELKKTVKDLSDKNKKINDSIAYAKLIQSNLLPDVGRIAHDFKDFFLIFIPKDIVSGDFYWYYAQGDIQIYIIADCTGHGVPGAFLSIAGKTYLDQIIKYNKVFEPDKILFQLNTYFEDLLNKANSDEEMFDGMEIAVFKYDKKQDLVEFSGAGRNLLYFENTKINIVEGDINGIGDYEPIKNFNLYKIDINKDKRYRFYLCSDGFVDQFGGNNNKKFGFANLQKLIKDNYHLPMTQQSEIYQKTLADWMKGYTQIDDITFTGFEIK